MKTATPPLTRLLAAAWLLLVAGTLSITGYSVWRSHDKAVDNGLEVAALLSRGTETHLTQSLHLTELAVANTLAAVPKLSHPPDVQRLFEATLHNTPFLRSISLLDASGQVVVSSNPANVGQAIPQEEFLPETNHPVEVMRVGRPWEGRDFAQGRFSSPHDPVGADEASVIPVMLSRQVAGQIHHFLLAINPDFFLNHIQLQLKGKHGQVEVMRYDGLMLMDSSRDISTGAPHWVRPGAVGAGDLESGQFEENDISGRPGLTAFRSSSLYPLVVVTHLDRAQTLSAWRQETQTLLTVILSALLVVTGLTWAVLQRQQALARQRAEAEHQQRINATVFEASAQAIIITDVHARIMTVNSAFTVLTGYLPQEVMGANPRLLASGHHDVAHYTALWSTLLSQGHWAGELVNRRKDGQLFTVALSISVARDTDGSVLHFVGVMSDVSAQKAAQAQLQLAASVFSHAREGILITNAQGDIVQVNEAFCRITGYTSEEVVGHNPRILNSGIQDRQFYQSLWHDLQHQGYWYGEVWNRRKGGEVYAEMLTISAIKSQEGRVSHYVALFSDITTLKEKQSQLEHVAHYDALTQLPNRVLLADRLRQGMHQAVRRQQALAVAFLDLDGFKAVNDTHGHDAGDHLLVTVAQRMRDVLRDGDTLARMGGDEFVVVLVDTPDAPACVPLLTRLLAAASTPVPHGPHALQVSASLGITFYPQAEEVDAEQLMRQADQAMYQAKIAGKNRYRFFDPEADRCARVQHESLERLRLALDQGEMVLHYQPKVNLRTGRLRGVEALIRWQHPERGLLLPADFLPGLAGHPLALDLGEWVIRTALAQISQWQAQGLHIAVSVNVDADQVQHGDFVTKLREMLAAHPDLAPDTLELEVVESQALDDLDAATEAMAGCQAIGVSFALDDFGTGYSSLAYLKRLPVKLLKIDQSFVRDMLDDPEDLTILDGVISLASAFRREVLAEGLETEAHGELLLRLGCELAQGYGIARPMPAQDLLTWANTWRPPTAWAQVKPVRRDQLPLLFASIEVRAWFNTLVEHLTHPTSCPAPDLDQLRGHLGPLWGKGTPWAKDFGHPLGATLQALAALTQHPEANTTDLWRALALRDHLLRVLEQALEPVLTGDMQISKNEQKPTKPLVHTE